MYEAPVMSILANNSSVIHKALLFLMRLAWKSRIRLPYLIMVGFMVLDIRMTLEVIIDVEVHQTAERVAAAIADDSETDTETDSDDSVSTAQPLPWHH